MKVLVLLSGGIDSSTCLGLAINLYGNLNVIGLSIYYGQKHEKELQSAREIANYYKINHIELDIKEIFKYGNCSLLKHSNHEIPKDSYKTQLEKTQGKPVSTYVPYRNGLFLSIAASIALSNNCKFIYYGIHRNDSENSAYPDCTKEFNQSIMDAIYLGSGNQVELCAPFVTMTKKEVIKKGYELKVPFELTWSCYEPGDTPCLKCATCLERIQAFADNGLIDPAYEIKGDMNYGK